LLRGASKISSLTKREKEKGEGRSSRTSKKGTEVDQEKKLLESITPPIQGSKNAAEGEWQRHPRETDSLKTRTKKRSIRAIVRDPQTEKESRGRNGEDR